MDVSTLTELSSLDKARAMVTNERSLDALSYLEKVYEYVLNSTDINLKDYLN